MKARHLRDASKRTCCCEPLEPRKLLAAVFWDGGGGDGLWNTPANWSNNELPGVDDDVTIDVAGTYTVTLIGDAAAIRSLTLGGASGVQTLDIGAPLSLAMSSSLADNSVLLLNAGGEVSVTSGLLISGRFDWLGGTLSGPGEVSVNSSEPMSIAGPADKQLKTALSIAFPTAATWDGGDILFSNGELRNNGIFNAVGGTMRSISGMNLFSLTGPFNQTGTTSIEVRFNAIGNADTAVMGTLTLGGGGLCRVTMDVSGVLIVDGPTFEVLGVGRIIGSGTARFIGGTHFLSSASGNTPHRLEIFNTGTTVSLFPFAVDVLEVRDGAEVQMVAAAGVTKSLLIDEFSRLDVGSVGLILDYTGVSPINQTRDALTSGYADGAWSGAGIMSSTAAANPGFALGYAESSAIFSSFPASFLNREVDDTAVLIRYTRNGDANLDGMVDLADFNRVVANFGTGNLWSEGNFNYDEVVNLVDFNRLAGQFGESTDSPDELR